MAGLDIGEQPLQGGALHRTARETTIVVALVKRAPALMLLAEDISGTGLALGVERVEVLLETLLGRLARIDRAAGGSFQPRLAHPGLPPLRRPKKAGPLRREPVISRAIAESDARVCPRQR